jgi:hypothetical protein
MISNGSRIAVGWSSFQSPHERYFDTHSLLSSHCLQWDDDVVSADLNEAQSLLKSL